MIREVYVNENKITYVLNIKKVKNINLRIKTDGMVYVSANAVIPKNLIDEFVISKADFIFEAFEKYKNQQKIPKKQYFNEEEICEIILKLCDDVYPYFEKRGVKYPKVKFRKMVSLWGSCNSTKGVLTFNINLMYAPPECVKYVVLHEFTHFLQANHSDKFYKELAVVCPDWKALKEKMKKIIII